MLSPVFVLSGVLQFVLCTYLRGPKNELSHHILLAPMCAHCKSVRENYNIKTNKGNRFHFRFSVM